MARGYQCVASKESLERRRVPRVPVLGTWVLGCFRVSRAFPHRVGLNRYPCPPVSNESMATAIYTSSPSSNQACYFVQGTTLAILRTENPAAPAALANRSSPQMKFLLEGRCSHQINAAESCKLSAARKECLSSNCVAKSRT